MVNTEGLKKVCKKIEEVTEVAVTYGKPIVHWGFIPAVILVGMYCTKPAPTFSQLLLLS